MGEQLTFATVPYDGPVAARLVAEVQQEYVARYGGPDDSPVDPAEFTPPHGRFLVAVAGEHPVATGGVRLIAPGVVELKRMYVVPAARGRGHARRMLAALEAAAVELGARRVQLETGLRQPEAIRLYETSGYARIPNFGHYRDGPLSVSFGKDL